MNILEKAKRKSGSRRWLISRLVLAMLVMGSDVEMAHATVRTWTGGGMPGNPNWSNTNNWVGGIKPNPAGGDAAVFNSDGLGVSVVDQDWVLNGLTYNQTNAPDGVHVHDLAGNRLTLASGLLQAGHVSNTHIVISNGVFQVGKDATSAEIRLGRLAGGPATNGLLKIFGTFETRNRGNVYVGYNTYNNRATYHRDMTLDLGQTVIVSDGATNGLTLNNLYVGYQFDAEGLLRLPASLTNLHVNALGIANEANFLHGTVDLGANSQLRSIICDADFLLGRGGTGQFLNWPTNVNVTVGASGTPARMEVGYNHGWDRSDAALVVSNAVFTATLTNLVVGYSFISWSTGGSGFLDLEHAQVQIGATPNQIKADALEIASGTGLGAVGELRLPASLTSIEAKIFSIGNAYTYTHDIARATLRLGTPSQLTNLVVTQEFYFGHGCNAFLFGFPAHVNIRVGAPEAPAKVFYLASKHHSSPVVSWTPEQARVSVYVDDFRLGSLKDPSLGNRQATGTFDLRQSTVEAFVVTNQAWIAAEDPDTSNANIGQGYFYLPSCDVFIHKLAVGVGTHATRCEGVIGLQGGTFEIGASLRVGSRGRITSHVNGESGGPWLNSDDSADFVIDANGKIQIIFDADPLDLTQRNYWGLVAAGDQVDYLTSLAAAGRLTWDTTAMLPYWAKQVGIQYDKKSNITYVGFDPRPRGTMLVIR